jgi:hypothetical protein
LVNPLATTSTPDGKLAAEGVPSWEYPARGDRLTARATNKTNERLVRSKRDMSEPSTIIA